MRLARTTRLAVVGAGLIGASLAAALRKSGAKCRMVCVDRSAATRRKAVASGLFDEALAPGADPGGPVDLAFLAVPVMAFPGALAEIAPALAQDAVVFDAGSVKAPAIAAARDALGERAGQFVPCHPIAGSEHHGFDAADPGLFRGKSVIVTPGVGSRSATDAAGAIWRRAGAKVRAMRADLHDEVFSVVSHLPHALAFALVETVGHDPRSRAMLENAASGFRDFTRIASSSPEMWRDILLANRANVLDAIGEYEKRLAAMKRILRDRDGDALARSLDYSKSLRNRWLRKIEG